jgi:hypothetical protein
MSVSMKKTPKDRSNQPTSQEILEHVLKKKAEGFRPIHSVRKSLNKKLFQKLDESS